MSENALFDDSLPAFDLSAAAAPRRDAVDGWVKTLGDTGTSPIATLNFIPRDGNAYRAARFELLRGAAVGVYPVSQCRGVKPPGHDGLISLYEAVQQGLAREVV